MEEHDSEVTALTQPQPTIVQTWIGLGTGYARKVLGTGFSSARDVHGEWKARLKDVFDLVEGTQQGLTSLGRTLAGRVDSLVEDTLTTAERSIEAAIDSVGTTADDAATGTRSIWSGRRSARQAS